MVPPHLRESSPKLKTGVVLIVSAEWLRTSSSSARLGFQDEGADIQPTATIASISTLAPFGSAPTSTAARAGGALGKKAS